MKTFCADDLEDCDLVPCFGCHKLFHPSFLDGDLRCESCFSHADKSETADS